MIINLTKKKKKLAGPSSKPELSLVQVRGNIVGLGSVA